MAGDRRRRIGVVREGPGDGLARRIVAELHRHVGGGRKVVGEDREPLQRVAIMAEAVKPAALVVIIGDVAVIAVHVEQGRRRLAERVVVEVTPWPSRPSNRALVCRPSAWL